MRMSKDNNGSRAASMFVFFFLLFIRNIHSPYLRARRVRGTKAKREKNTNKYVQYLDDFEKSSRPVVMTLSSGASMCCTTIGHVRSALFRVYRTRGSGRPTSTRICVSAALDKCVIPCRIDRRL